MARRRDDETPPDLPRGHSTRRRFVTGLLAAGAAGAGGTGIWSWYSKREQAINWQETGDTSRPVRQDDVDAAYNQVYTQISDAYAQAKGQKKKLIIELGELHDSRDALLVQLMALDVL